MDSTFERLDREIREARSKLMGQEEALKSAMTQINEDVEGKLDRLELAPLKEYFGKSLNDVYVYTGNNLCQSCNCSSFSTFSLSLSTCNFSLSECLYPVASRVLVVGLLLKVTPLIISFPLHILTPFGYIHNI